MPALVSALNKVDLPTLGSPTIPHLSDMGFCLYIVLTTEARRHGENRKNNSDAKIEAMQSCSTSHALVALGFLRALRASVVHSLGSLVCVCSRCIAASISPLNISGQTARLRSTASEINLVSSSRGGCRT